MYWPLGAPRIYSANKRRRKVRQESSDQESEPESEEVENAPILGLQVSRNGHLFTTITETTLTVWQASPVVVLACITRSAQSLNNYGKNVDVLLRPDSTIAVVQTSAGYLVTYSILVDPNARVYQQFHEDGNHRRQSSADLLAKEEEKRGFPEVNIRFRMVIKVDAGISKALALDDELIVATEKPAAVQCIRWTKDDSGNQTNTELISRMGWVKQKVAISDMVFDRAMSLAIWLTGDGRAYAVQRLSASKGDGARKMFRGHCFHDPETAKTPATKLAINARFSLLAVACDNAQVLVYAAKDYVGNIPLSHTLETPASMSTSGQVTSLAFSPDGHCLFAGFEKGWALWSVYGKLQASSFASDPKLSESNGEGWLQGVQQISWLDSGTNVLFTRPEDHRLWGLELAKSIVTGCYTSANVARTVLLANTTFLIFRGYDLRAQTTISADPSLWLQVQIPKFYLQYQRPMRCAVISSDGKYLAVAGRRGLAHYSITSGRWKTFDDQRAENSFVVRGGMCWYQHLLVVAAETDDYHELRVYSRERGLNEASPLFVEKLPSAVVTMTLTGPDSLLVYTYRNILYHFVINASPSTVNLVQVGQIALNGIVRAPARVRAVSWILPEHQLRDGDPSNDVACASIIFLVDAKLVVLQASTSAAGEMKYDMRVIASNVEYFDLVRNQSAGAPTRSLPESLIQGTLDLSHSESGLNDSLWYFDGKDMHCWIDVADLIDSASTDNDRDLPPTITIATDYYPTSISLSKGLLLGLDADLIQRRDSSFAFFRHNIRTQLFLPDAIRQYLSENDHSSASSLALRYQHLPYFSHALEMLLHQVLDEEVDKPADSEDLLLPSVVSFLSSFPDYLDIIVQCTRKTEVRSWRTLFQHLPPPKDLFEASLEKDLLKTAGGYLIVMQTFENAASSEECVRLLRRAKDAGDWELGKELARFLMALDSSGDSLRSAMKHMEIAPDDQGQHPALQVPTAHVNGAMSPAETSSDGEDYHDAR